jgi:PAS domain-containing protein
LNFLSEVRELKSIADGSKRSLFWVAIGLLPLFVYGMAMLLAFRHLQAQAIEHELREAANSAAHLVDRAIGEQLGVMNGMTASLAFDRGDLEAFRREAQRLWRMHPEWRTVIVTDEREPLLNLRFPPGEPMTPLRDPQSLAEAWATQQPLVGNLVHAYLVFRVPVVRDGRTVYTIVVPTDPRFFGDRLSARAEGQPWTAAVVDGDGQLIAATADSPLPGPSWTREIPRSSEGFLADGNDYLAWAPVGGYGWRVAVVAPAAAVEQPFARTRWAVYLGGAFAAVLTALLLLVLGSAWASRREAARLIPEVEARKRAQEALTLTIEHLRLAHEAAHSGTWEWDLQTNRNVWSDELWSLYGLAPHSCEPSPPRRSPEDRTGGEGCGPSGRHAARRVAGEACRRRRALAHVARPAAAQRPRADRALFGDRHRHHRTKTGRTGL